MTLVTQQYDRQHNTDMNTGHERLSGGRRSYGQDTAQAKQNNQKYLKNSHRTR